MIGRHEAYYRSTVAQTLIIPPLVPTSNSPSEEEPENSGECDGKYMIHFEEGELVHVEYSYKVRPR